ncbi:BLUF domain-containing protein [Mucilaginibacter glaciei]|uniref:BLUF domain-containing protein n=1 Tax=Mucilaginibacter glaciei TaxID=2772109 RepID=A0A926S309_9SPHI|nr:BLUF domain-containing protein [Mucilaginibacter glaciei]MBD1394437.1 BLUF domain-containing protein [Mucilaginibacter glaciei]
MKNIVYVSTAIKPLPKDILMEILVTSRLYNQTHNISGILLYAEGTFIQVLEGDDNEVDHIFGQIITDNRHKNIIKLIDGPINHRSFADWLMGFSSLEEQEAANLLGYLRPPGNWDNNGSNSASVATIKAFFESNQLNISY